MEDNWLETTIGKRLLLEDDVWTIVGGRRLGEDYEWKTIENDGRRLVEDNVWTIVGRRRLVEDYEWKTIEDD